MSTTRELEIDNIVNLFSKRLETELGLWAEMVGFPSCQTSIKNNSTQERILLNEHSCEVELSNPWGKITFVSRNYYNKLLTSYHIGIDNYLLKKKQEELAEKERDESAYNFLQYYN